MGYSTLNALWSLAMSFPHDDPSVKMEIFEWAK